MEMFYLYILRCSDGSYYIGHTDNLEQRFIQHQDGCFEGYTSARLPVELVYYESGYARDDVFLAEQKIKKWTRKKKEVLIKYGWNGFKK